MLTVKHNTARGRNRLLAGLICATGLAGAELAMADSAGCTITLNNTQVNFGQINRGLLSQKEPTVSLGQRSLNLSINCATPTDMTLFYRATSLIGDQSYKFGDAGRYQLTLRDVTVDGKSVEVGRVALAGQAPEYSSSTLQWQGDEGITAVKNGKLVEGLQLRGTLDINASVPADKIKVRSVKEWVSSGRFELMPGGKSSALSLRASVLPVACVPTLSQGGKVNMGKISHRDLRVDNITKLQSRVIQLNVTCDAPASFALKTIENQPGTAMYGESDRFGLGTDKMSNPVGAYTMSISSATSHADGMSSLALTRAPLSASTWSESQSGRQKLSHDSLLGFTTSSGSTTGPDAFEQLNTMIIVEVEIAPTKTLKVSDEIMLKGSATIEIHYL